MSTRFDVRVDPVDVVRRGQRGPRRHRALVVAGLALGLAAAFWVRVLAGDYQITFGDFWRILGGRQIPGATFILTESKLPRACLGILVGVALGVSGAVFQSTLRNPLASPDVIGVSSGASVAAVAGIVLGGLSGWPLDLWAVAGALAAAVLVRTLAGPGAGSRLVLVGVTVSAGLLAGEEYLFTRADTFDAQQALRWLTGSLSAAEWSTTRVMLVPVAVLLALTATSAGVVRAWELGDDSALGLGVRRWRVDLLLAFAVVLDAVAVAAAGPVAFVAFAAGPISRALNAGRGTVVGAALVGAITVVGADYVGAYAFGGLDVPAGVITGAFGAPVLIWLLVTSRRSA